MSTSLPDCRATAIQDGPDFYLFASADDEEPVEVVHAPFGFDDGDVTSARKARVWFMTARPDVCLATGV